MERLCSAQGGYLGNCSGCALHRTNAGSALAFLLEGEVEQTRIILIHLFSGLASLNRNQTRFCSTFSPGLMLFVLRGVKGSEGEGGTQMHSVQKLGDLKGQAEIKVNKQGFNRQVIRDNTVQKR